jgi:hypothetical protein
VCTLTAFSGLFLDVVFIVIFGYCCRIGHSTSLGRVKILSKAEFKRATSYFAKEWIIFAGLVLGATVGPNFQWYKAKIEYSAWLGD